MRKMDIDICHYDVLGLPSGEEAAKLTEKEISKAYKSKALELHPDKRPNDPNAHINFQKLKASYEILKDEKTRKLFDDLLKVKRDKVRRQFQQDTKQDTKRRKMMSDLERREQAAFEVDSSVRAREEEDTMRKLQEEIARYRSMLTKNTLAETTSSKKPSTIKTGGNAEDGGSNLNKEKILKVFWEKIGGDYSSQRLKELFEKFGIVEDVLIKNSKKRGSALVVMGSKDAADAVTRNVLGDVSNRLLVTPLQPVQPSSSATKDVGIKLSNLVGSDYEAFEHSVLEKLKKAAEEQKSKS